MPFCPECRDEFQDWVTVCPDCKVALVSELKDIPEPELYIVHIATAPNEAIAGFWAGILEYNRIPCLLKTDNLRPAQYSLLFNQYHRIYVLKSAKTAAKRLLHLFIQEQKTYAHSRTNILSLISRILLLFCFPISIILPAWGGYFLGMFIIWISYKLSRKRQLE